MSSKPVSFVPQRYHTAIRMMELSETENTLLMNMPGLSFPLAEVRLVTDVLRCVTDRGAMPFSVEHSCMFKNIKAFVQQRADAVLNDADAATVCEASRTLLRTILRSQLAYDERTAYADAEVSRIIVIEVFGSDCAFLLHRFQDYLIGSSIKNMYPNADFRCYR